MGTVVYRLNYLALAVDLKVSSTQHLVRISFNPTLIHLPDLTSNVKLHVAFSAICLLYIFLMTHRLLSLKPSKDDELDMWDTFGEARTNS